MKTQMTKTLSLTAAALLATSSANAVVVQVVTSELASAWSTTINHTGTIQALSGDLLESSVASFNDASVTNAGAQYAPATMIDGVINTGWNSLAGTYGDASGADFAEYVLDTSVNTLGYDISEIIVIHLSGDTTNRPFANVDIELGFVGGGSASLHSTGQVGSGTAFNVNKVSLTDDSGLLGTGVNRIKFIFGDTGPGTSSGLNADWTWYRELDVVGTATVPEPGSLALLGLGGLLIGARRRRG